MKKQKQYLQLQLVLIHKVEENIIKILKDMIKKPWVYMLLQVEIGML